MTYTNPFLDPIGGHVLADDAEEKREAANTGGRPQPNAFLTGTNPATGKPGYGVSLQHGVRLRMSSGGGMKVVVGYE